jgi:hypothetical protein
MIYLLFGFVAIFIMRISYKLEKITNEEIRTSRYYDSTEDPLFLSEGEEVVNGKYRRIKND